MEENCTIVLLLLQLSCSTVSARVKRPDNIRFASGRNKRKQFDPSDRGHGKGPIRGLCFPPSNSSRKQDQDLPIKWPPHGLAFDRSAMVTLPDGFPAQQQCSGITSGETMVRACHTAVMGTEDRRIISMRPRTRGHELECKQAKQCRGDGYAPFQRRLKINRLLRARK